MCGRSRYGIITRYQTPWVFWNMLVLYVCSIGAFHFMHNSFIKIQEI